MGIGEHSPERSFAAPGRNELVLDYKKIKFWVVNKKWYKSKFQKRRGQNNFLNYVMRTRKKSFSASSISKSWYGEAKDSIFLIEYRKRRRREKAKIAFSLLFTYFSL